MLRMAASEGCALAATILEEHAQKTMRLLIAEEAAEQPRQTRRPNRARPSCESASAIREPTETTSGSDVGGSSSSKAHRKRQRKLLAAARSSFELLLEANPLDVHQLIAATEQFEAICHTAAASDMASEAAALRQRAQEALERALCRPSTSEPEEDLRTKVEHGVAHPSGRSAPAVKLEDWDVEMVLNWLDTVPVDAQTRAMLAAVFKSQEVDGRALSELSHDMLRGFSPALRGHDAEPMRTALIAARNELMAPDPIRLKWMPSGAHLDVFLEELHCPISGEVMRDPVCTADGHSYERASIESWLRKHDTSPRTNLQLSSKALVANHQLRALCDVFRLEHATADHGTAVANAAAVPLRQKITELMSRVHYGPSVETLYSAPASAVQVITRRLSSSAAWRPFVDHTRLPRNISDLVDLLLAGTDAALEGAEDRALDLSFESGSRGILPEALCSSESC